MKHRNIHIGKLIKQQFDKNNITISQFARAINSSRANIYNIFNAKSIDIDKLIMISEALNHDFLLEYTHDAIPDNSFVVLHIHAVNGKYFVKQVESNIE